MTVFVSFILFVLGAITASFVGVLVARLSTGQSPFSGRSRCDACGVVLPPIALVPIVSYIAAHGRAQCCGARISIFAPISEALLGSVFMLTYLVYGFSAALPFTLISLAMLLALVLYDLAHQILPTPFLIIFIASSAVASFLNIASTAGFIERALVALILASILLAIHFFSRGRAMGLADAPLVFGLVLLTGPAAFSGFVFSFWIGAVIGIAILLRRPRGSRMGVEVPFAPFLAAGFLLAYLTQWNLFTIIAALSGH